MSSPYSYLKNNNPHNTNLNISPYYKYHYNNNNVIKDY